MARFRGLMRDLREAEPNNPQLTYFAQPNTVPSEAWLARLQAELAAALARARPVESPPPPPLVPGTLTPRPGDGAPDQPDPNTERERASLRRNMQIAGTMQRNDTREVHHVVPGGGPMNGGRSAVAAQQQLARFDISLQSATNGIVLSPKFHRKIHTRGYYDYIQQRILRAGSRLAVEEILQGIRANLQKSDQIFQSTGQMPMLDGRNVW